MQFVMGSSPDKVPFVRTSIFLLHLLSMDNQSYNNIAPVLRDGP